MERLIEHYCEIHDNMYYKRCGACEKDFEEQLDRVGEQ